MAMSRCPFRCPFRLSEGPSEHPHAVIGFCGRVAGMDERPCNCLARHCVLTDHPLGGEQIVPAKHAHEDRRCAALSGCPGLPHCRDWILGDYSIAEKLASLRGDAQCAFEIRIQYEELKRAFALRRPLSATDQEVIPA